LIQGAQGLLIPQGDAGQQGGGLLDDVHGSGR